jgi:transcriptional regulator with XRE-family HTH domain
VGELKNGKKTNPSLDQIRWLAAAFGVSAGYFTDDEVAERVDAELDRLAAHQQNTQLAELAEQTVSIAERTANLDESDKLTLAQMVEDYWRRRTSRRKS